MDETTPEENAIKISIDFNAETLEPIMLLGLMRNDDLIMAEMNAGYANRFLAGVTMGLAHLNRLAANMAEMDENERRAFIERQRMVWASEEN